MQELIVNEGQLLHQRTELEREQKHLCSLLNATPLEFAQSELSIEPPMSIVEINRKLDEQIQMLRDLKVRRRHDENVSNSFFLLESSFQSNRLVLRENQRFCRTIRLETNINDHRTSFKRKF